MQGLLAQFWRSFRCARPTQHVVADTDWNLFYHLGGNGPWIPKVDGVIDARIAPPTGCVVDQVHMVKSFPPPCYHSGGNSYLPWRDAIVPLSVLISGSYPVM